MPMYNLVEYSYNYSKTFGSLWQYYRDEPSLTNAGVMNSFLVIVLCLNLTDETGEDSAKDAELMVPLKYLSNFWRTLEIPFIHCEILINCEINLVLTWPVNFVITNAAANQRTTFAIADRKLHVPIVTLST